MVYFDQFSNIYLQFTTNNLDLKQTSFDKILKVLKLEINLNLKVIKM